MKEKFQNANKHNKQQKKNVVKMKKDAEHAAKRYCRICKNIISPVFQCSCSGGGEGNEEKSDLKSATIGAIAQKTDTSGHQISAPQASDTHVDIPNHALAPKSLMR